MLMAGLTTSGRIRSAGRVRLPVVLLLASVLICYAPGFDSDERQLDLRLDAQTIEHCASPALNSGILLMTYGRYLG